MSDELDQIAERLESERPVPAAGFRGELRRSLLAHRTPVRRARPQHLRLVIAAYAGSGLVLLAIAAVGLAGVGPLAA